jgi:type IV pilus assembly protein PilW
MQMRIAPRRITAGRSGGFTLIELMIALLIGIFLLGALLTIVQTNRTVFGDQNKMAQLQDGERMAVAIMSDVIESTGYFPPPVSPYGTSQVSSFPSATLYGVTFATGQTIAGQAAFNAGGDQVSVRYSTMGGDGILNCSGLQNPGAPTTANPFVNTFEVLQDANGINHLVCIMNGTQYNLVSGVNNLTVLYGLNTGASATGNSVDTYMTADKVTLLSLWSDVVSIQVQLQFTNPMYPSVPGQPQNVTFTRVIALMNQAGPFQ